MADVVIRCEVCGRNDRDLTIDQPFDGPGTIRCSLCQGLVDSNIIRLEIIEGVNRYRQWHIEWSPGDLLPLPKALSA